MNENTHQGSDVHADTDQFLVVSDHSQRSSHGDVPRFSNPKDISIGVVTLGLIGGSLALALQERGVRVAAWDRNPQTRDDARALDLNVVDQLEQLGSLDLDLVIVASPLVAMPQIMLELAKVVSPKTTITDAGSVKERVRAAVDAAGLGEQYVGAHPMAGTEKSGFAHANAELFEGATWALTLSSDTEIARVALVLQCVTQLLNGKALVTDDQTHDRSVALISHLPHVLSHALTATVAGAPNMDLALKLAAGSFRDTTRVARGSASRNQAMIAENSSAVRMALGTALEHLTRLYDVLGDADEGQTNSSSVDAVSEFFTAGAAVVQHDQSTIQSPSTQIFGGSREEAHVASESSFSWQQSLLDTGSKGLVITGVKWHDQRQNPNLATHGDHLQVRVSHR